MKRLIKKPGRISRPQGLNRMGGIASIDEPSGLIFFVYNYLSNPNPSPGYKADID
jgi:hypothetical protein